LTYSVGTFRYQNSSALIPDANREIIAALKLRGNWIETVPLSSHRDMTDGIFCADPNAEIGNISSAALNFERYMSL
jgi:hypothetical protein